VHRRGCGPRQGHRLDPAKLLERIAPAFAAYGKRLTAMDYVRANSAVQTAAIAMA